LRLHGLLPLSLPGPTDSFDGCIGGESEGNAEADCPARCTNTGEDGDECLACQGAAVGGVCKDAFDACMAEL